MRVVVVLLGLVGLAATGCGASLRHPTYTPQVTSALESVERAPPPARVEIVPDRPDDPEAVWVDGEWIWRRGLWAWFPGRWVKPPAGAMFSAWVFLRRADGTLWYARGTWRDAKGAEVDGPTPLAVATVEAGPVVDADGTMETTGPTQREGPRRKAPEEEVPADAPQASPPVER
jgi:hypothetical protein